MTPPGVTSGGEAATETIPAVAPTLESPFDTKAAEEEIGRLVLRVRDVTNSMLEDARRQAEQLMAQARADAASLRADAERNAEKLRADNGDLGTAAEKLKSALVTLGEVNAALVRQLGDAHGSAEQDDGTR